MIPLLFIIFSYCLGSSELEEPSSTNEMMVQTTGTVSSSATTEAKMDNTTEEEFPDELPITVLKIYDKYELREVPSSKWICIEGRMALTNDTFDMWQKKFGDDPFAVMANPEWQARKDTVMHATLKSYLQGLNSKHTNITMRFPVTAKVEPADYDGRSKLEICTWTGKEWARKRMPDPRSRELYFYNMRFENVYVRKFGGWALSWSDWEKEWEILTKDLIDAGEKIKKNGTYFAVEYQSPTQKENRRNEIWIVMDKH